MRKRIFEIIEVAHRNDIVSKIYDYFLIGVIGVSLIPIIAKLDFEVTLAIDSFALVIFIGDYLLRWLTADYKYKSSSSLSFIRYPFSFSAIIDLLVIVSLLPINYSASSLGLIELFRIIRILHVFRLAKYSKSIELITKVFRREKNALLTVVIFTTFYILTSAIIVFTAEPATFDTFFDAIYWAVASLTTVSYEGVYPISLIGRIISMFSSLLAVLVVALPTGIIASGFMKVAHEETRRAERLAEAATKAAEAEAKEAAKAKEAIKEIKADDAAEEKAIKKVEKTLTKISKKWKTL